MNIGRFPRAPGPRALMALGGDASGASCGCRLGRVGGGSESGRVLDQKAQKSCQWSSPFSWVVWLPFTVMGGL